MRRDFTQKRDDHRIIIHFDYDAFYASVVEAENPALKSVPLAIQQKQIVVTCNYEARRRGLHKLQLITEAKRVCPEAVIVLGEDLTRFRDASKFLSHFLNERIWSGRLERLGFDEVWLDCTDMIDYNLPLLNSHDLEHSFFCLDRDDPTTGFEFDARSVYGPTYPASPEDVGNLSEECRLLHVRLILGSHLARFLRHELESQQGYTATVGIATNKILSKLVGNVNKPHSQTTLMPPLLTDADGQEGTIHTFLDTHDVGKVPGIGFKVAQKIRAHVLGRQASHEEGLVYGSTKEHVTVRDVRLHPSMGPEKLEEILGGPGAPKGIGGRIWGYLNGFDESEVIVARRVPSQISQEDSYMKYLHTFDQVRLQLSLLAERLISRMHMDLTESDPDDAGTSVSSPTLRWLAHPRTLRLTTRPRPPVGADGTRFRTFNRISHSGPMPNFVFSLTESSSNLAEKLVDTTLVPMFRKLHPERNGWNLSLINVAATNMTETAADHKASEGRDIGRMFRRQDDVLKDFKVLEDNQSDLTSHGHECVDQEFIGPAWEEGVDVSSEDGSSEEWEPADDIPLHHCTICGLSMPIFASVAHSQYHQSAPGPGGSIDSLPVSDD